MRGHNADVRLALQADLHDDIVEGTGCEDGEEDREGAGKHHGNPTGFPVPPPFAEIAKLPWD